MTNVAYLLFTFMACLFGLGIGLVVHHVWSRARPTAFAEPDPFASINEGEATSWDVYSKWQSDNNKRFAAQVVSCGAAPLLIAGASWSERGDVVHSLCNALTHLAGQPYICM